MSISLQNHLSGERVMPSSNLTSLLKTSLVSQEPQDYVGVSLVIKAKIEPYIRAPENQITMKGNILPREISEHIEFKKLLVSFDPLFILLVNPQETPYTESISLAKTTEKVNEVGRAILFMCRIDKDKSILEKFYEETVLQLRSIENFSGTPFDVSLRVLMSKLPPFPEFTDIGEFRFLSNWQDSINQGSSILDSKKVVIVKGNFAYGKYEMHEKDLSSFELKSDEIVAHWEASESPQTGSFMRSENRETHSFYL